MGILCNCFHAVLHAVCYVAGVTNERQSSTAKPKRWGKSRPFLGQVVAVEGLCQLASTDDKDTIRVEVDLEESGLQYTPGDALGVYPLNCTQVRNHARLSNNLVSYSPLVTLYCT